MPAPNDDEIYTEEKARHKARERIQAEETAKGCGIALVVLALLIIGFRYSCSAPDTRRSTRSFPELEHQVKAPSAEKTTNIPGTLTVSETIATVTLKNGQTFKGRIVSERDDKIVIERPSWQTGRTFQIRLDKSMIEKIDRRSVTGEGVAGRAQTHDKLTYEVVDRDTYDAPVKTQVELQAVVSGAITELGLRQLLQQLYNEANATRGFKYHGGRPTHVFIHLYESREHFRSGMGHWIAMLSKVGEDSPVNMQVKTEALSRIGAKPETKYGLPEPKRKEIFKALVRAEERADAMAERMYPLPDPLTRDYSQATASAQAVNRAEASSNLLNDYRAQIATRYHITEEQLGAIVVEGVTQNWPDQ